MIRIGHLTPSGIQEETLRAFYQLVPPGYKLVHASLQMQALRDDELGAVVQRAELGRLMSGVPG